MELRRYFRILRRWKWLAAAAFVITSLAAAAFVLPQRSIYESSGTWLIRSDIPGDVGNAIDAANALSQNVNIVTSYATVARSDMIRRRAIDTLGSSVDTSDTKVDAEVLTGTNVLSISVRGPDPSVDRDFAEAVGQQLVAYVVGLRDPYAIDQIDAPKVSRTPVAPNKKLTIGLGVVLGLMLGIGLALLAEYLSEGARSEKSESYGGLGLDSLLRVRLRQEMTRTDRSGQPFTVGLLKASLGNAHESGEPDDPDHVPTSGDVRHVEELLRLAVPDRVVVSYLGGGDFGAIMPGTPRREAVELLGRLTDGISSLLERDGAGAATLSLWAGACEYADGRFVGDSTTTGAIKRLMGGNSPMDRAAQGMAAAPRPAGNGKAAPALVRPGEQAEPQSDGERSGRPTLLGGRDPAGRSLLSRKLVQREAPAVRAKAEPPDARVENDAPQTRVSTDGPDVKAGREAPEARTEGEAPEARTEREAPQVRAEAEAPEAPVEAEAPEAPVESEAPEAPVESEAPEAPVESEAPEAPVESEAPEAPVESEAPEAPVEAEAPEAPGGGRSSLGAGRVRRRRRARRSRSRTAGGAR